MTLDYVTDYVTLTSSNVTEISSSSSNVTEEFDYEEMAEDTIMESPYLLVLFITLYGVIFFVGVSGNALVVYVVIHSKAMQTITNIFIANLAVADIIMCLLAVPFTPLSGLLHNWFFGDFLCHVVPMAMGVSVHVSTLTSTAIAIDRYFVIVHPFMARMKSLVCMVLIGVIWTMAVSISLPLAIYQTVTWVESESIHLCHEDWPQESARQFFTVVSLILQYIVPCSIISLCYGRVSAALRQRARVRLGTTSRTRDQLEIQRKRKTNRMLIAMVTIFVCCWLPLNVIQLLVEYHQDLFQWKYFLLAFFVTHVIAMSSTIYNPFLYAWMNENFKKEFREVIPQLVSCCCRIRGFKRSVSGSSQIRYDTVDNTQNTVVVGPRRQVAGKDPDDAPPDVIYHPKTEVVQLRL